MITIAACDDEPVFIDIVSDEVRNVMSRLRKQYSFHGFTSSVSFMEMLESRKITPDVVFLDIMMPGIDGKEAALRIGEMFPLCRIIFMTSYESEIFTSFDYNVSGFISKFSLSDKIGENLERVLKKLEVSSPLSVNLTVYNSDDVLEHRNLLASDIVYLECIMKKAYVTLTDGSCIRVKCSIWRDVVKKFAEAPFAMPHQNYIVNMMHISGITSTEIKMNFSDTVIPLSKHRRKEFMKECASYSISKGGII